ncbi:MAG: S8 family serine peptidase, partial [Burkholderiaceae bacterium]
MQALSATAGVGLKSVREMVGGASLLALDTAMPLSRAQAVAARLRNDPAVVYAVPDVMYKKLQAAIPPNDPRYSTQQWNLFAPNATYSSGGKSVTAAGGANLPPAWSITTGQPSVVVAVIDTGIVNHPDLNGSSAFSAPYAPNASSGGRFLPGYDFVRSDVADMLLPANFVSNDGDGRDNDPTDPGDWITTAEEAQYPISCDDGVPGPQHSSWHGSHMAGIAAAATNNADGIAGIGWNVRVLPVRALGKCGGSLSDISEAIVWAAGAPFGGVIPDNPNPAQVINVSLGSSADIECDG